MKRLIPPELIGRVAASLGVGAVAAAVQVSGVLSSLEDMVLRWFMADRFDTDFLPLALQGAVIVGACLLPAIIRFEHPLALTAYGFGAAFMYMLIFSVLLLASDTALPVIGAMAGLAAATLLQGTRAWNGERIRRRRLEEIENARRQFTDMLVHDLKRRMSSILMSLSVLERTGAEDARRRATLTETIRASAERMLLLTGNLLDIRKMEESRFVLRCEPTDVGELAHTCLREHRGAFELSEATCRTDGQPGVSAHADRSVLLRALANLLWNALQHSPRGGEIEIAWHADAQGDTVLSIANGGPAIPDADQSRLFTAFLSDETVPENSLVANTGLGLTFCKLAIEAHRGTIAIASPRPGHDDGVLVTVRLPGTALSALICRPCDKKQEK